MLIRLNAPQTYSGMLQFLSAENIELNVHRADARAGSRTRVCHTAQAGIAAIVLRGNSRDHGRMSQS